ncbi:MAG: contact-dependent growth inhibition system immunity protein [Chthoniobacterales bacterium]
MSAKKAGHVIRADEFRVLSEFLSGYLHQDFRSEYETPKAAVKAYRREATHDEVERLRIQFERFVAETRAMPFTAVQQLLVDEFHSGWLPQSREDLTKLVTEVSKPT